MSGEGIIPSDPRRGAGTRFRRGTIICPVCGADGRISGRDHVTPLVTTLWVGCSNLTCGQTWRMQLAFEYVISPSAIDRPEIDLPQAPADFPRQTYAQAPPGAGPDPNQITMFDDGDGGEQQGTEGERAAA